MTQGFAIAVVGTFDSKGEEHAFIKSCIERRGFPALTMNVGTKDPSTFRPDYDLYEEVIRNNATDLKGRDEAVQAVLERARELILELHEKGEIGGIISAGGGTGTHLGTSIMHVLPVGVPKVMVSTVASRNMAKIVGTKDITMIHSVADILGVNAILGNILDKAAGAICGMVKSEWKPEMEKKRIALSMFGFITQAAENTKRALEEKGYEVVAFHANGTGGMAMEELAAEGYFHGILDLATHELADHLKEGYCGGIGPERLRPVPGRDIPRLVVPGGLDCAVLEFTRQNVPQAYQGRKIFYYDFRSAIRLSMDETLFIAHQLSEKLNLNPFSTKVLIPNRGWSEADRKEGPLYAPEISKAFVERLKRDLTPDIEIKEMDVHINDPAFAEVASALMDEMVKEKS